MSDRLKRKRNAIILKDKVALDDWIKKTLPYKYPNLKKLYMPEK